MSSVVLPGVAILRVLAVARSRRPSSAFGLFSHGMAERIAAGVGGQGACDAFA